MKKESNLFQNQWNQSEIFQLDQDHVQFTLEENKTNKSYKKEFKGIREQPRPEMKKSGHIRQTSNQGNQGSIQG